MVAIVYVLPCRAIRRQAGICGRAQAEEDLAHQISWTSGHKYVQFDNVIHVVSRHEVVNISSPRKQAGVMLWQLLYPPGGARTERQLDALKLNGMEVRALTVLHGLAPGSEVRFISMM